MIAAHNNQAMKILLIEDNPADARMIREMLADSLDFFDLQWVELLSRLPECRNGAPFDSVLLDLNLPDSQGIETFDTVQARLPGIPIILLTGRDDEEAGTHAVRRGAQEYLVKGKVDAETLARCIKYAIERNRLINELRNETKEVEESKQRLHSIIETNFDGFVIVDQQGRVQFVNPSAMKMLDCKKPGEIIGTPLGLPVVSGEKTEIELISHNGGSVTAEMRAKDIQWAGASAHLVLLHDITGQKKMEENLMRLATVVEQVDECILITDTKGNIQYVNPAFESVSGYESEMVMGRNPRLFQSGKQPEVFYSRLWNTITRGNVWKGRFTNKKKDGTLYEVEATISPVKNAAGDITNYVAVKRDITEAQKTQMQLRQAQKVEAIGTLAGGIAHDFNNILTAIIGYTEISMQQLPEDGPIKSNLDEVYNAGNRAKSLVKQILTFSRQANEERVIMQMKPVVNEVLRLVRSTLPTTIEIRGNIAGRTYILADPAQIHQVVLNLCTNAAQAMYEEQGLIEVGLEDTELDGAFVAQYPEISPGPFVMLTVRDTGCGMTDDILENIFDPYFTTKTLDEGTGLGLAVTHGIVKSHAGLITVASEPGKGTMFQVYLPSVKHHSEGQTVKRQPMPRGSERILFVDDEAALVNVGKKMLSNLGYRVETRTSSHDALNIFKSDPGGFDLVITDLTMPHMTGDVLAQELVKTREDIPVILCTGFSKRMTEQKAKEIGIAAFLMKPLIMRQIAETIREVLDNRQTSANRYITSSERQKR